jgi:protease I
MKNSLDKVRVAVLAVDGFEQVEVTLPMAALKRAGADVRIISVRPGRIRGMNFIWPGRTLPVDDIVADVRVADYGALFLPGGFISPDLLRQNEKVRALVRGFEQAGRPIATICHGPEVLISADLVRGRRLATWPGIRDDIRNAGGEWVDEKVVRDRNWVSSRSPLDLRAFIPGMIDLFTADAPRIDSPLPRRWRAAATASRVAGLAAIPLALTLLGKILGRRGDRRPVHRQRRSSAARWVVPAATVLAGAGLFGKMAGGRRPGLPALVSRGYARIEHRRQTEASAPGLNA